MVAAVAPSTSEMPTSPVPLDTIPISPNGDLAKDNDETKANSGDITVFHDSENFNVKHPLMNKWTLWFTKPPSGKVSISDSGTVLLLRETEPALTGDVCRATTGMTS